jgi:hemoglobin/transferrin/lactoferrin receptor protein
MLGAYVQDIYKVSPDRFTVNAGLRYNYINLNSRLSNNMPLQFPYSTIKQNNNGITGNVGLIFTPDEEFAIILGYSSGFKAPNLDDAARLFESGNGSLVVPNQNLAPEYAHNIDFGVRYNEDNKIVLSGNLFYTSLFNAIVMDRYTYNGDDSTLFYGTKMPIVALQNSASAKIYGFAGNAKINLTDELIASGSVTYTAGRYDAVGTKDNGLAVVPMDHIPPVFGRLSLQYLQPKYNLEVYSLFNGRKALSDYNPLPASEDNLQYAIAGYGTPGWITLNVKGTYAINPRWTLQGGVENIFDTHYRTFASGISAPGVNAILALRLKM